MKLPNIIFIFGPLLWCVFTSYFLYTGFVTEKVINVKDYDLTSYARLDESPWAYWINMAMIGFSTFGSVLVSYVFFLRGEKIQNLTKSLLLIESNQSR